jgi:hypothetical protein
MGRGGVPGWAKPPPPFKKLPPSNTPVPPGYKRQGYMEEQICSGGKYTGEWKNNLMHGRGEFKFTREGKERGDYYVGEWQNGHQHGKGTYYYRNGDRYEGEWARGQKTGRGMMFLANGDKYEGDFSDGERKGRGTWHGVNGNTLGHVSAFPACDVDQMPSRS